MGKGDKKTSALFNIAADPSEESDLSDKEPAMLAKMSAALAEISASDNDRKVAREK